MGRLVLAPLAAVLLAAVPSAASSQVVLDRVLSHVNGEAITLSDVRQARLLKLVPGDDAAVQTALENRKLILAEVARAAPYDPPAADVERHRARWEQGLGADAGTLAARAGMTPQALDTWFRDDLRIEHYLNDRFRGMADADRAKAIADWTAMLRARADIR
jgi:hypothetical protein